MNNFLKKKLRAQSIFWRRNNRNSLCWAFYCVNNNKKMNAITLQIMQCILCHNDSILNVNPKTKARKGLVIHNSSNGISTLKKHVNLDHPNIFLKFEKEINCPLREDEKQPFKKRPNVSSISISSFFVTKEPF